MSSVEVALRRSIRALTGSDIIANALYRAEKGTSIKRPISVPVSASNAVECYPCREVSLNYNESVLFHGGDKGSTPVRDANIPKHSQDSSEYPAAS